MIDSNKVEKILVDCLFNSDKELEETPKSEIVLVEGITVDMGFHKGRLESHKQEIIQMLYELPDNFQSNNKANGWSFLEACVDKNGTQWTGEPHFVELLMILGLAIGRVEYCLPKKMWSALPKGLPYFRVLHENEIEDKEGEST